MRLIDFLKPTQRKVIIFIILTVLFSLILRILFGIHPYLIVVASHSMSPSYNKGDVVFLKSMDFSKLQSYDVVAFKTKVNSDMVISRIISIDREMNTIDTKGDNNKQQWNYEKNIHATAIRAKVVGKIPLVGFLDLFYIGWIFRMILIYFLSCGIVYFINKS